MNQDDLIPYQIVKLAPRWCVMAFDNKIRSQIWGEGTVRDLYARSSCKPLLAHIDKPFLILTARDDPICQDGDVPTSEILSTDNALLIQTENGGHCDFLSKNEENGKITRLFPEIVIQYMDEISNHKMTQM